MSFLSLVWLLWFWMAFSKACSGLLTLNLTVCRCLALSIWKINPLYTFVLHPGWIVSSLGKQLQQCSFLVMISGYYCASIFSSGLSGIGRAERKESLLERGDETISYIRFETWPWPWPFQCLNLGDEEVYVGSAQSQHLCFESLRAEEWWEDKN